MDNIVSFARDLQQKLFGQLKLSFDIKAGSLTTFGVGANIPVVIEPNSINALLALIASCRENCFSYRILGAGSNIVMPDRRLDCIVVRLGDYFRQARKATSTESLLDEVKSGLDVSHSKSRLIEPGDSQTVLTVFSRASLMQLSNECCRSGFAGLECAGGIPASVGGAIKMNAGAHGWDIGSITKDVLILDMNGNLFELKPQDLGFSYRSSAIRDDQVIIASRLALCCKDDHSLMDKRKELLDYRRRTQPITFPSAGSVFRNPSESSIAMDNKETHSSAGWLLDQVGLKGCRIGGVEYSSLHANWLIKVSSDAKARDVVELVELGQARVKDQFGIFLDPEIKFW